MSIDVQNIRHGEGPTPIDIPALRQALHHFHDEPDKWQPIFESFQELVIEIHNLAENGLNIFTAPDAFLSIMQHKWSFYSVEDILARVDIDSTAKLIRDNLDKLGGAPGHTYRECIVQPHGFPYEPPHTFTTVSRGMRWLVYCASRFQSRGIPALPIAMRERLYGFYRPQPIYTWGNRSTFLVERFDHRPSGFRSALEYFGLRNPPVLEADDVFYQKLKIFFRAAIAVGDAWNHAFLVEGGTAPGIHPEGPIVPSPEWYQKSKQAFVNMITKDIENPVSELRWSMRNHLRFTCYTGTFDECWALAHHMVTVELVPIQDLPFRLYGSLKRDFSLDISRYGNRAAAEVLRRFEHPLPNYLVPSGYRPSGFEAAELSMETIAQTDVEQEGLDRDSLVPLLYHEGRATIAPDLLIEEVPYGELDMDNTLDRDSDSDNDSDDGSEFFGSIELAAYTEVVQQDAGEDCTICCEPYFPTGAEEDTRCVSINVCHHRFHYQCLDTWVHGRANNASLCPMCRRSILDLDQMTG